MGTLQIRSQQIISGSSTAELSGGHFIYQKQN